MGGQAQEGVAQEESSSLGGIKSLVDVGVGSVVALAVVGTAGHEDP